MSPQSYFEQPAPEAYRQQLASVSAKILYLEDKLETLNALTTVSMIRSNLCERLHRRSFAMTGNLLLL